MIQISAKNAIIGNQTLVYFENVHPMFEITFAFVTQRGILLNKSELKKKLKTQLENSKSRHF